MLDFLCLAAFRNHSRAACSLVSVVCLGFVSIASLMELNYLRLRPENLAQVIRTPRERPRVPGTILKAISFSIDGSFFWNHHFCAASANKSKKPIPLFCAVGYAGGYLPFENGVKNCRLFELQASSCNLAIENEQVAE